jgi:hypothetical protein
MAYTMLPEMGISRNGYAVFSLRAICGNDRAVFPQIDVSGKRSCPFPVL